MSEAHIEFRAVIHFLFLKGLTNAAIYDEITAVYGNGTQAISLSMIKFWTKEFKEGRTSLVDRERSGRPRIPGLADRVKAFMDENPFVSQKKLAKIFVVDHKTMHTILTEDLNLVRVNFKWIPHTLSESQRRERVALAHGLLGVLASDERDWINIITGDETWVYLDNPREFMWQEAVLERPTKQRPTIGSKKVMFTVMWSAGGIKSISVLPPGGRFNREYFEEVLDEMAAEIRKRRPVNGTKGMKIHLDNARPHIVPGKIDELEMTRLPHPPYSPDLAPSDFFLFGYLKNMLQGTSFARADELFDEVFKILHGMPRDVFNKAYQEWIKRLTMCIERDGDYVH